MTKWNGLKIAQLAKRERKNRIFEIDFLRGFDLILMIAVHFCFAASFSGIMGILFDRFSVQNGTIEAMNRFCENVFWGIINSSGIANPFGPGSFHLLFLEIFFSSLINIKFNCPLSAVEKKDKEPLIHGHLDPPKCK